jgi:hypothetical protein
VFDLVGPPIVAFVVALVIASLDYTSAEYPRTFFILRRVGAFWLYVVIYALIGGGVMGLLRLLIQGGAFKLEGLFLENPFAQAVAVGVSVKALTHIRLYTVTVGTTSTPIGIETLVALFEPRLLRSIIFDYFVRQKTYLADYVAKYSDLASVRRTILANVPNKLPTAERDAFEMDLNRQPGVQEAMELSVQFAGGKMFERIFPK